MALQTIRDQCLADAATHQAALPQRFLDLAAFVRDSSATPDVLTTQFTAALTVGEGGVPPEATATNPVLVALLSRAQSELCAGTALFTSLETWLMLCIPPIEDGNNFGVGIVVEAGKLIKEARAEIVAMQKDLPEYHKERGAAVEKVAVSTSNSTTVAQTSGEDTTAKDGAEEKTAKQGATTVQETKTSSGKPLPDFLSHVVAVDVAWHARIINLCNRLCTLYIAVADFLEKNDEKIRSPKGSGGSSMMY